MMKKLSIPLLLTPILSFAAMTPAQLKKDNIKIVPLRDMPFTAEMKKHSKNFDEEVKKNGYFKKDDSYPRKLLSMRDHAAMSFNQKDPATKELKKSLFEIPLTFNYSFEKIYPNALAFTGIGIVSNQGFSGFKEFFDGKEAGMCTFSLFSRKGVNTPIFVSPEGLRNDINNKITRVDVEGSQNSGFLYNVIWYDRNFIRNIECANMTYDTAIADKVIGLAKSIDY